MTAEEKLKALYKAQDPVEQMVTERLLGQNYEPHLVAINRNGGILLAAEHIDLIADLVVERLIKWERDSTL